jgi:hypothetical protein
MSEPKSRVGEAASAASYRGGPARHGPSRRGQHRAGHGGGHAAQGRVGTPDQETENAQITVAQFYIDAQRANGTLVKDELFKDKDKDGIQDPEEEVMPGKLQYFAETGDPEDDTVLGRDFKTQEDLLIDERTVAKPMIITYYDEVEHDAYDSDGVPDKTVVASIGGTFAKAIDDVFDADALASGGVPDPEHRLEAFASVSFDDGETWSATNLSETALRSSFTLKDGTVYPGTVDYGVKHSMAGNKILVVWHGKYARQGSPRYAQNVLDPASETDEFLLDTAGETIPLEYYGRDGKPLSYFDPNFDDMAVYFDLDQSGDIDYVGDGVNKGEAVPLDIWGVAGSQGSIDYTDWMHHGMFPFAEVGEVPFSAVWTCRGTIQQIALDEDEDGVIDTDDDGNELKIWGVKWRKAERLTSAKRDAIYTAIDGAENAGFGIVWQEDPTGLRPGYGEGPGEGWSGSTAHHKTDLWYSFITWEDFDKVENPLFDDASLWDGTVIDPAVTPIDLETTDLTKVPYFQTPEQVDALGWDIGTFDDSTTTDLGELTTNKPQPYEKMSMPQRVTDNNNVICLVKDADPTEIPSENPIPYDPAVLSPVLGGPEGGPYKVNDLYAWLDLEDMDGDGLADGDGIPDMVAAGFVWQNSQDKYICNAVTQDGRLLNGQQWSTRTRMMLEGYDKYILDADGNTVDENGDGVPDTVRSAWLLMGYEDSKGLGPGAPLKDAEGNPLPDEEQPDAGDIGKVTKCDTFEFTDPSYAKPGHMLNAPDLGNPGYEIDELVPPTQDPDSGEWITTTVPPRTGLLENDLGELQYGTPIARRPSLFVNPILKIEPIDDAGNIVTRNDDLSSITGYKADIKMKPGMTSAIMLFKEGTMRQGGPADIMLRRWVVPGQVYDPATGEKHEWDAHWDNPYAIANLVADVPTDPEGDIVYEGFTEANGNPVPLWEKQETGTSPSGQPIYEYVQVGTVDVDADGDGWDKEIMTGSLFTGTVWEGTYSRSVYPAFDDSDAHPAFDDFTSEYYPNGVLVKGVQNVSSTVPLDVRELDSSQGEKPGPIETIPAWHLDLMPDLKAKVDDGTLSFTDCYSCHPDSWGVKEEGDYPSHGILNRVWWWSQTDGSDEVDAEILDVTAVNNYTDPDTLEPITGDTPILSITPEELKAWGPNQYDEHWKNPYELAKGHRGHIDGNDVMVMFGYAPNWLQSHYGAEPINLFVRRSFDGGRSWTTTPDTTNEGLVGTPYTYDPALVGDTIDGDGVTGGLEAAAAMQAWIDGGVSLEGAAYGSLYTDDAPNVYSQVQGTGDEEKGRVFFYLEDYAARDFERQRNVSQYYDSSSTIIDPRYSPTNFRRQTAIIRKLSAVQIDDTTTGDVAEQYNIANGRFYFEPMTVTPDETLFGEDGVNFDLVNGATPLEPEDPVLLTGRTDDVRDPSKFFAVYESGDSAAMREGLEADAENLYYSRATEWGDTWEDVLWVPNSDTTKGNPDANTEPSWYWDWLENAADDKSGEASVGSSPGGQFFYATWNQWTIYEGDEHEHNFDAIYRRCYWVPDILRDQIFPEPTLSISPDNPVAAEGEVVTLTATVDMPELADRLLYVWDLDGNGSFESTGETVKMVASGAMQHVTVIVKDKVGGGITADDTWINGGANKPMVWNVRTVDKLHIAGQKTFLRANFRSPALRWNGPAPADYDFAVEAQIDWGDGTVEPGAIASQNDGKGSKRFIVGEHRYHKPGLYPVRVTLTNAYGASGWDTLEYVVVVHRRTGVTSVSGTFQDPNGGGVATLQGKAKYRINGKFPVGKITFALGDMTFQSEKLDWMAIDGRKSWVRGQGQLNGQGGYEFLLSVVDDRLNRRDFVRMKIWTVNGKWVEVVYDSQPGDPLSAIAATQLTDGNTSVNLTKGKVYMKYKAKK